MQVWKIQIVSMCNVRFETLQQIDAELTNRREGWVGLQQKERTLKFPAPWLKAQIVLVKRGGKQCGRSQGHRMTQGKAGSQEEKGGGTPLYECLSASSFCFAVLCCRPRQ